MIPNDITDIIINEIRRKSEVRIYSGALSIFHFLINGKKKEILLFEWEIHL